MSATCVSCPTKVRKASVRPSGEMRGFIANFGPPSDVPANDRDGGAGRRRRSTSTASAIVVAKAASKKVRQYQEDRRQTATTLVIEARLAGQVVAVHICL